MIVCRSFNISSVEDKDKPYFQVDSTTPVTNHFYDQFLTTGKGMNMCHILQVQLESCYQPKRLLPTSLPKSYARS